ncbi:MAG: transcription termination/antitermination NusG family protein [Methyloceanibacter sp.]
MGSGISAIAGVEFEGLYVKSSTALASHFGLNPTLALSEQERWYVARTLPQRELHAGKQLENQGFRVFLPCYWKSRRHARRVETISAALFPRYIFVILDRTRDRWRCINGTLGVERLLMQGGEPQTVPHGVVEGLINAADPKGFVQFHLHLKEGQMVRVTAGPFADLVGQLQQLDENGRVRVLLEIMGGKVRVTLPQTLVAPN